MAGIRIAERYERKTAVAHLRRLMIRWFPAGQDRVLNLVDATEQALKDSLPGHHVRVTVERMVVSQ
jgi:hypothetical protein